VRLRNRTSCPEPDAARSGAGSGKVGAVAARRALPRAGAALPASRPPLQIEACMRTSVER